MKSLWFIFFIVLFLIEFIHPLKTQSQRFGKIIPNAFIKVNGSIIINVFNDNNGAEIEHKEVSNDNAFNNQTSHWHEGTPKKTKHFKFVDIIDNNVTKKWNSFNVDGKIMTYNELWELHGKKSEGIHEEGDAQTSGFNHSFNETVYGFEHEANEENNKTQLNNTGNTNQVNILQGNGGVGDIKAVYDDINSNNYNWTSMGTPNQTEKIAPHYNISLNQSAEIINETQKLKTSNITPNSSLNYTSKSASSSKCLIPSPNNSTTCSKCIENAILTSLQTCECPYSFFYNYKTNTCQQCPSLCKSCYSSSWSSCTSCDTSLSYYNSTSSNKCNCNQGLIYDKLKQTCVTKDNLTIITHRPTLACSSHSEEWVSSFSQCAEKKNIKNNKEIKYSNIIYYNKMSVPELDNQSKDILGITWSENHRGWSSSGWKNGNSLGKYIKEKYRNYYNWLSENNQNSLEITYNVDGNDKELLQWQYSILLGIGDGNDTDISNNTGNIQRTNSRIQLRMMETNSTLTTSSPLKEENNPFLLTNDAILADEITPSWYSQLPIPSITTQSPLFQLSSCKDAQARIEYNKNQIRSELEKIAVKIDNKWNLKQLLNLPASSNITPEIVSLFIKTYFIDVHIKQDPSMNAISVWITYEILEWMKEFYKLENYNIIYGEFTVLSLDNNNELKQLLLQTYTNQWILSIKSKIESEKLTWEDIMIKYQTTNTLDLTPLTSNSYKSNVNIDLPTQDEFFGLVSLLTAFNYTNTNLNNFADWAYTPMAISFDLYKENWTLFNYTDIIINYSNYTQMNYNDSSKTLDQSIQGNNTEIEGFAPTNINEFNRLMNNYFNNTKLYSMKVYVNNDIIFDDTYERFEDLWMVQNRNWKLVTSLKNDIELFCEPKKENKIMWVVWMTLGVISVLEVIAIVGWNLIKGKY